MGGTTYRAPAAPRTHTSFTGAFGPCRISSRFRTLRVAVLGYSVSNLA